MEKEKYVKIINEELDKLNLLLNINLDRCYENEIKYLDEKLYSKYVYDTLHLIIENEFKNRI